MRTLSAVTLVLLLAAGPVAAEAQGWRNSTSRDEMTGEVQAYALSPRTSPTKPMDFPYQGVEAFLAFGCDGQDEWAYVGFTKQPNLTDTETHDGYNSLRTRVRWDDEVTTMKMTQEWGSRFIHLRPYSQAIKKIRANSKALVELNWYGSGSVYFRFSLDGSTEAIESARETCRGSNE